MLTSLCTLPAGDSFINVRKGKLIASYELDVSVGWAFKAAAGGEDVRGWLQLPYLSEVSKTHDEAQNQTPHHFGFIGGASCLQVGRRSGRAMWLN